MFIKIKKYAKENFLTYKFLFAIIKFDFLGGILWKINT